MTAGPSLTPEQRAAVEAADGPYLVVAPPGSGKTEVLVRRVLWLIERSPGEPFRVLAITYTNKAAQELGKRARSTLGEESWRATATTLHAFCHDMLQRYGEAVGVTGELSVYDTDDLRLDLLGGALVAAGYAVEEDSPQADLRTLLDHIDRLRHELVVPELAPDDLVLRNELDLAEAYRIYEDALDDARAMDFPGMLFRAWRLLTEDPWVTEHYRRQYRHILVDEAQDLTQGQAEIIRALCGDSFRNVFIVADDEQEIFGFAGASSEHYVALATQLGAQPLSLSTNFRCATAIVKAAESLRQHIETINVHRVPVIAATPASGSIVARAFRDPVEEARAVGEWTRRLVQDGLPSEWLHPGEDTRIRAEDICVMARTRYGFDPVIEALDDEGLPYVVRTEDAGLFDSRCGQAAYLGLRVLANPRDRASTSRLVRLLGVPAPVTAAETPPGPRWGADGSQARPGCVARLADLLGLPQDALADDPGPAAADLLEAIAGCVPDDEDASPERELWEADRLRFQDHWERYAALTRVPDRSLAGFLRQLSRLQRTPPDAPGVRLLTPYRAKGLQFRAVVITGMAQGLFPHYRATDQRALDEERRVVYVAVTRASRAALLTRAEQRTDRWGRVHRDPPSPFLAEMGLDG